MDARDPVIDFATLTNDARQAQAKGDWGEALRCWQAALERFPNRPAAYAGAEEAFRALGQMEKAEAVLGEGMKRFPDNIGIAVSHAQAAQRRGDWAAALSRWQALRRDFPDRPLIQAGESAALIELGRFDEAEALLGEAAAKFPKNAGIAVNYAAVAQRRGSSAEALRRWQSVRERFPDHPSAQAGIETALSEQPRQAESGLDPRDAMLKLCSGTEHRVAMTTSRRRSRGKPMSSAGIVRRIARAFRAFIDRRSL